MPTITLDYAPFPYQREFHDSPARFKVVLGGRRSGKSKAALQQIVRHALEVPDANAWWVSPTLADARDVGWDAFKEELADDLRPLIQYTNEMRMMVRFRNGSRITFKGSESEQSLRGRSLTFLVVDEFAFVIEGMWKRALRPALADRQGSAVLCSTPNGLNWAHALWEFSATRPNWARFHWPSRINPILSKEELDDAKAALDPREWEQEFEAKFVSRAGQVYPDFSDANIVPPFSPLADEWNVYLGIDPGFATKAAVVFLAVPCVQDNRIHNGDTRVVQFDELYLTRRDVHMVLSEIDRVLARHGLHKRNVRKAYTDVAANTAESTSGLSPANIIRAAGYQVENKQGEIAPGLALVRSFILSAAGVRRFQVTSNCTETIRSLRGYSYATGRGDQPKESPLKDGLHDHLADALRYALTNKFDPGSAVTRLLRMAQM